MGDSTGTQRRTNDTSTSCNSRCRSSNVTAGSASLWPEIATRPQGGSPSDAASKNCLFALHFTTHYKEFERASPQKSHSGNATLKDDCVSAGIENEPRRARKTYKAAARRKVVDRDRASAHYAGHGLDRIRLPGKREKCSSRELSRTVRQSILLVVSHLSAYSLLLIEHMRETPVVFTDEFQKLGIGQ